MLIEELLNKKITNIYSKIEYESGGLDRCECFIEIDHKFFIDIPFNWSDDVWIKEFHGKTDILFNKTPEINNNQLNINNENFENIYKKSMMKTQTFLQRSMNIIFKFFLINSEFDNSIIKDRIIIDFIWYNDILEKGYILLDNGYLITETIISPNGTGLAGLNLYSNINELAKLKGNDFIRLSSTL